MSAQSTKRALLPSVELRKCWMYKLTKKDTIANWEGVTKPVYELHAHMPLHRHFSINLLASGDRLE